MVEFIRATGIKAPLDSMQESAQEIVRTIGWGDRNQIGLTHRPGSAEPWLDAIGSLYDRERKVLIGSEYDFTIRNPLPPLMNTALNDLAVQENVKFGRIRIMRLLPRTGLSVHKDNETRYHYVLSTNNKSYMCKTNTDATEMEPRAVCYHVPLDGQWYHVNTREMHWVYNGGNTERVHLVVCALD